MKIMVVIDNEFIYKSFEEIIKDSIYSKYVFEFRYSNNNIIMAKKYSDDNKIKPIDIKKQIDECFNYDLIITLHCKQIFPENLIRSVRCINVHPGYNPYNRGWYPQVFSILNKKKVGVTVHEIDEQLDHGKVIIREEVEIEPWETSYDVYQNIIKKEVELLKSKLVDIIENNYKAIEIEEEGNINYLKDFKKLCEIDLNEQLTMGEAIDKLRAVTFKDYKNAYYEKDGHKIYITINLEKE